MQEFPSDPEPFHYGDEGDEGMPDDHYPQQAAPDSMTSPDFYQGQDIEPDPPDAALTSSDAGDAVEAGRAFDEQGEVALRPELGEQDLQPATEETMLAISDVIGNATLLGAHIPESRRLDGRVLLHGFRGASFLSEDEQLSLRLTYFPNLLPRAQGDPVVGKIIVADAVNPLAGFNSVEYELKKMADGGLGIEKYVTLEPSIDPDSVPNLPTSPRHLEIAITLQRFFDKVGNRDKLRESREESREMGLTFVSQSEAAALLDMIKHAKRG